MSPANPGGRRPIALVRASHADDPALDTALSHAFLDGVAEGRLGETLRLYVPGRVVAFGRQDIVNAGYREAVAACRAVGYEAVERLAGGRAAVFHEGTLAFSWAVPTQDLFEGIAARFREIDQVVVGALRSLGFDARVGEVEGEYCPGRYSVNLGGRWKVMGVGQRLRRGVAHVGGVVAVSGRGEINRALTPVYEALGFGWRPEATGSLRAVQPGIGMEEVLDSLVAEVSSLGEVTEADPDAETLKRAAALAPGHIPG